MRHFLELPLVALSLGIVTPAARTQIPEPFCACVDLGPTVDAVKQIAGVDWSKLDEGTVAQMWPQAEPLPCETSPLSGIAAVTAGMERCCNSCGTCGGPFIDSDGSSTHGLRSILVSVCRQSSEDGLSDLKRLVDATVPEQLDASYEEGWSLSEKAGRIYNGYRWQAHGSTFILHAFLGPWEDSQYGSFELTRCDAVTELEEWVLEGGTKLSVTEVKVEKADDGERQLWFSYQTQCLLRDYKCLQSEWRILWPGLRSVAEREDTTTIFLSSEDCSLGSITMYPKRNSLGDWELPW